MSWFKKLYKNYVSEIDLFLQEFDRKHPQKSYSQLDQIKQFRRIYYLRDVADRLEDKSLPDWF